MQFGLLAATACCCSCWDAVTSTPRSLLSELLSSPWSPSLCLYVVLFHPQCCTQHFHLNFMSLLIVQGSKVSRSFHKASCSSSQQFSLVSSANSLKMHSTPVYRPLIKMLNSTGTRTEPWGILPVTAYQPNVFPLTMNLCALPFSQIITQQRTTQLTGWTVTFATDVLKKYFFYWHHTK